MYQYKQLIQEPTRVTTKTKSLIDHFLQINRKTLYLQEFQNNHISDHYLIYTEYENFHL